MTSIKARQYCSKESCDETTKQCIVKSKSYIQCVINIFFYRTTVSLYTKKGLGRISNSEISGAQRTVCC